MYFALLESQRADGGFDWPVKFLQLHGANTVTTEIVAWQSVVQNCVAQRLTHQARFFSNHSWQVFARVDPNLLTSRSSQWDRTLFNLALIEQYCKATGSAVVPGSSRHALTIYQLHLPLRLCAAASRVHKAPWSRLGCSGYEQDKNSLGPRRLQNLSSAQCPCSLSTGAQGDRLATGKS